MDSENTICYEVKDWDVHFENGESRRYKSLTWVPVKNKHDGKSYRRVSKLPNGVQVFCAWSLIIQVASKMPIRGMLRDEDGPITTADLADMTGFPESIFEMAFKSLSEPKIGWLVAVHSRSVPQIPADAQQNPVTRQDKTRTDETGKPAGSPEEDWNRFCRMKGEICVLMNRPTARLNHVEESILAEIARRPEAESELKELIAFKSKPESFFPGAIESLVQGWDKTLDRARNYETNRRNNSKSGNRNEGTYNAGKSSDGLKAKVR